MPAGRGRRPRREGRPEPRRAAPAGRGGHPGVDPGGRPRAVLAVGYANLSTRAVAEAAEVPLSQIHYHFGSKQQLILAILEGRTSACSPGSASMFSGPEPLWRPWERACDYLDEDLESGYVRILQEMIAAGWSDAGVAAAVRELHGRLVSTSRRRRHPGVASLGRTRRVHRRRGRGADGPPVHRRGVDDPARVARPVMPARSALRKLGGVIRSFEEGRRWTATWRLGSSFPTVPPRRAMRSRSGRPSTTTTSAGTTATASGWPGRSTRTCQAWLAARWLGWVVRGSGHPRRHGRDGQPPGAAGAPDPDERRYSVDVSDTYGDIAAAVVHAIPYVDYLHLVRTPHGGGS